jgi:plastocyanin
VVFKRYRMMFAAVGFAALCSVVAGAPVLADPPDQPKVVIKNFMFSPVAMTVAAGSTVTWANMDDEPHTVISDSGLFRSGAIDTHESYSFKFDKPGTYRFTCSLHPQMVGTILVQ